MQELAASYVKLTLDAVHEPAPASELHTVFSIPQKTAASAHVDYLKLPGSADDASAPEPVVQGPAQMPYRRFRLLSGCLTTKRESYTPPGHPPAPEVPGPSQDAMSVPSTKKPLEIWTDSSSSIEDLVVPATKKVTKQKIQIQIWTDSSSPLSCDEFVAGQGL